MSARQLIVLVIAAIAAVGALLLIRGLGSRQQEQAATEAEQIAGEQVLVAARDIAQGAALAPGDLAVTLFPASSVSQSFVRINQQPSAQADYVGGVTRRAFVQGEPITASAVVQPEGRGFLAAQLEPGFRAVAVDIDPATAAGNYIQPNDRVDVLVTSRGTGGEGAQGARSDIVLTDIRVIALGETTQPQTQGEAPEQVETSGIAVLELTAEDARVLALANEIGTVSLALRGVEVETVGLNTPPNRSRSLGQQSGGVRIHAYGVVGEN